MSAPALSKEQSTARNWYFRSARLIGNSKCANESMKCSHGHKPPVKLIHPN